LPTAVSISDPGPLSNSIVAALRNSSISNHTRHQFAFCRQKVMEDEASHSSWRSRRTSRAISSRSGPETLIEADASDPSSASNAVSALHDLWRRIA